MLYQKNKTKALDIELFKNPTSEYRGAPFWAWNCDLDEDMLLCQIEILKQMGFGGFFMHTRSGMSTEYLSDEFMKLVRACRDKAVDEGMYSWLYDEDRWPSGSAGGMVTKTKAYRQKFLVFSENKVDFVSKDEGVEKGLPYLVGVFDIELDRDGKLREYRMIDESDEAKGIKRYAYVKTAEESGWFNGETYIDTLSCEAMQEFIKVTYEAYKNSVGDSFGKTVPAIFTDEPQIGRKEVLAFAKSHEDVSLPWTTDFSDTYKKTYGDDIVQKIPELFWELPENEVSVARYRYHDHVSERFTESFAKQCGTWCKDHGIALTGHMMDEPTLASQTSALGEAMRAYSSFEIPGIDMLCDSVELTTAKQTQSAKNQYGREAMLSELYGVTNWDFDFRGHKFQGDWQAALGVTVRVPHLAWVSMKGSAKRDYPASINYQAPWCEEYSYIENHFARLNTVLTRGKPVVDVGVIHPIESYWLHFGPADTGSEIRRNLDNNFRNITEWLLGGMVDFDFICESLLPSQCVEVSDTLKIGAMKYKTIVVPGCETIRRTTFEILKKFKNAGGRVLFIGSCPEYIDAVKTNEVVKLFDDCDKCSFERIDILNSLKQEQTAQIFYDNGNIARNFLHTLREDNGIKWLFIARFNKESEIGNRHKGNGIMTDSPIPENLSIVIPGEFSPKLYNTVDGIVESLDYEIKDGKTYIYKTVYMHDSLLIKLEPGKDGKAEVKPEKKVVADFDFRKSVEYERDEDNVYLLDLAEFKLDSGDFEPLEEIIRIDDKCREKLGYPKADGKDIQPWILGKDKIEHYVTLRFIVESRIKAENTYICAEEAVEISLNGEKIQLIPCGYYVDASIVKYKLGDLECGTNIIEIKTPIGKRTSIENCFLLGDFDVYVRGCEKIITAPSKTIGFSDITRQGMPFYGGNITYKTKIVTEKDCSLKIYANRYRGACLKVIVDGEERGHLTFAPYILEVSDIKPGEHTVEFKAFGNRVNTFGAVHNSGYSSWFGPSIWYTYKNGVFDKDSTRDYAYSWSYDYVLKETGILSSPIIQIMEN